MSKHCKKSLLKLLHVMRVCVTVTKDCRNFRMAICEAIRKPTQCRQPIDPIADIPETRLAKHDNVGNIRMSFARVSQPGHIACASATHMLEIALSHLSECFTSRRNLEATNCPCCQPNCRDRRAQLATRSGLCRPVHGHH